MLNYILFKKKYYICLNLKIEIMKTEKPNNPYAFANSWNEGMTLRDYFANSAMQSYLSSQYNIGKDGELECSDINICNEAYRIADAMLKQREL